MSHFRKGFKSGIQISLKIAPFIIPLYIFVDFFKNTHLFLSIAHFFKPAMKLMGLPGKAAIVILSGFLINLYAAIGAMAPFHFSNKEITIIGLVLGISHNLVIETMILSKSGVKAYVTILFRISIAIITGIGVNFIWNLIS